MPDGEGNARRKVHEMMKNNTGGAAGLMGFDFPLL
jgi:hypothetical protein